jgi:hypothetical protein
MRQKRIMPDRKEKSWVVDLEVLRASLSQDWLKSDRLITRDLSEMSNYLPHWILTVGNAQQFEQSKCCNDNIAPFNGALRCIRCDRACKVSFNSLIWTGLLPVNLEGRDKAIAKIMAAHRDGKLHYPIVSPNGKRHLMVPILVEYPANWPYSPPIACYADNQYYNALKISNGHSTHTYSERNMCLYGGAYNWNDNTGIMHVIANRIAPHAFALLRLANGEKSMGYF